MAEEERHESLATDCIAEAGREIGQLRNRNSIIFH